VRYDIYMSLGVKGLTYTKCMEYTEQLCVGVRPRVHLRNLLTGFEEMWGENPGWNLISFRIGCV
jgi:hypothetical protein